MKKIIFLFIISVLCLSLFSCNNGGGEQSQPAASTDVSIPEKIELPDAQVTAGQMEDIGAYTAINFDGDSASVNGQGASCDGSTVTIFSQGQYVVSGTTQNGRLVINTNDSDSVKVWLNGVSLTSTDGPAINIIEAPKKVVLNLPAGSVNIISDGSGYSNTEQDAPDAAIFSKADLKIKGQGTLYVSGNYSKGIVTKDDFEMTGGILHVNAVADGIKGKDSVVISDGTVFVTAGGDGIQSDNDEDYDKGFVTVSGGYIEIESTLDAIQAERDLIVSGGTLVLKSGGGSANASTQEGWGNWGGTPPQGGPPQGGPPQGGRPEGGQRPNNPGGGDHGGGAQGGGTFDPNQNQNQTNTDSAKGLKSAISVLISGGSITIDSSDDAIHSNNSVTVMGGSLSISSGDDGIHADSRVTISGGDLNISKSYEGVEAVEINITDGTIQIVSRDDGLNAAGGNDGSSIGGRPGQNQFESTDGKISFTGGYCIIDASGDGIDANGCVEMSGGFAAVFGPVGGGNGTIDYSTHFTVNGATFLAVGTADMMQTVSSQNQAVLTTRINIPADTTVSIKDSTGSHVICFQAKKQIQSIIFSSPDLAKGECTVFTGGSYSNEATNGIFVDGTYTEGTAAATATAS